MDGVCGMCREEKRIADRVLVGKPEGKRPLVQAKCWWEGSIKVDLKEIGREGVDWMHLAQDINRWWAVVNIIMKLWVL
jgi:hypothetical protein